MKRYSIKELKKMDGLAFAADVLKGERNNRTNPYSPVAQKLNETLCELEQFSEQLEQFSEAKLTYPQLSSIFRAWELNKPSKHLSAYIVFTEDSFPDKHFSLTSRTYIISSENKAFQPNMGGYSIFGSCLDGTDRSFRLESVMAEEYGGKNGWKVDYCLLLGNRR